MYGYYCLIVFFVIITVSLILYNYMKKINQADRNFKINLTICTVLAIVCANLTPILARALGQKLYFSLFLSVILSLLILIALSLCTFHVIYRFVIKKVQSLNNAETKNEVSLEPENLNENATDENIIATYKIVNELQKNTETVYQEVAVTEEYSPKTSEQLTLNETYIEPNSEQKSAYSGVGEEIIEKIIDKETDDISDGKTEEITAEKIEDISEGKTEDIFIEKAEKENGVFDEFGEGVYEEQTLTKAIDKAMRYKFDHNYTEAITLYKKALKLQPDSSLLTLIIVELCSLYKLTNKQHQAHQLLKTYDNILLKPEIKDIILQNL